jgi:putative membrane protein
MSLVYQSIVAMNLALQLVLVAALGFAVFLAKRRSFQRHCLVLRLAVVAQIVSIMAMMSPSMVGILEPGRPNALFRAEVLLHHGLGLAVILLWIYINLVFLGKLKARIATRRAMQATAGIWVVSFILGLHIYLMMYY